MEFSTGRKRSFDEGISETSVLQDSDTTLEISTQSQAKRVATTHPVYSENPKSFQKDMNGAEVKNRESLLLNIPREIRDLIWDSVVPFLRVDFVWRKPVCGYLKNEEVEITDGLELRRDRLSQGAVYFFKLWQERHFSGDKYCDYKKATKRIPFMFEDDDLEVYH